MKDNIIVTEKIKIGKNKFSCRIHTWKSRKQETRNISYRATNLCTDYVWTSFSCAVR